MHSVHQDTSSELSNTVFGEKKNYHKGGPGGSTSHPKKGIDIYFFLTRRQIGTRKWRVEVLSSHVVLLGTIYSSVHYIVLRYTAVHTLYFITLQSTHCTSVHCPTLQCTCNGRCTAQYKLSSCSVPSQVCPLAVLENGKQLYLTVKN